MRVQMIKTLASVRQTWLEGEQYDLPDERAESWIRSKVAQPVTAGIPPLTGDDKPVAEGLATASRKVKKLRKGATQ